MVEQPAIANTASAAATSFAFCPVILRIIHSPFVRPATDSPSLLCCPAKISPSSLGSIHSHSCHQQVTPSWTLLPSDQPTIGGVSRLPSRIRRVQARRRRCRATPQAGTLAGCMPPARHGRTDSLRGTLAHASGASERSGCATERQLPASRGQLPALR